MWSNVLTNTIHANIFDTITTLLALVLLYFILGNLINRKITESKARNKLKIRLFYTECIIFGILAAKIWMAGFSHIITMLSLVSAALVITNKEMVMNLVGWLIINWRGLFSEGDYVQIQQYAGYIYEIGPIYFRLFETADRPGRASGRVIRVPNGLVINNPVVNCAQSNNYVESHHQWLLTKESDFQLAETAIKAAIAPVLEQYYPDANIVTKERQKRKSTILHNLINLEVKTSIQLKAESPSGIIIHAYYYCDSTDKFVVRNEVEKAVFLALQASEQDFKLKFV